MKNILATQPPDDNPCIHCGACCGYFRVSFYWAEANDGGGSVPVEMTEKVAPHLRCMQGTNHQLPRCSQLQGDIGEAVFCCIYPLRPSTCRDFIPSWVGGKPNQACDRARKAYGLPALMPRNK